MSSKHLILAIFLAISCGSAWAQDEPDDEDDTKELSGLSVGGDMRTSFESDADIKLEKPDFSRDLKMESSRPSMSGLKVETARPKLEVVGTRPAAQPERQPERQQSTAGSGSNSSGAAGSNQGSGSGGAPSAAASGQTTDIRPLQMDPPDYPAQALRRRQEGSVTLEFTVTADGATDEISVITANPPRVFDREAIRAVSRWKFEPARINGVPQAQRIRHTIEFTLN